MISSPPRCCPATAISRAACNPEVRANYLASPPLVVAYALAGTVEIDLTKEPLGRDKKGEPVYLRDIWPSNAGNRAVHPQKRHPRDVPGRLRRCVRRRRPLAQDQGPAGETYGWDASSTYVSNPPYFEDIAKRAKTRRGHLERAHSGAVRR